MILAPDQQKVSLFQVAGLMSNLAADRFQVQDMAHTIPFQALLQARVTSFLDYVGSLR